MGIVCFFQADTKVGFSSESAGETAVESKQRIISRRCFGRFRSGLPDPDNNVRCRSDLRYGGQRCEKNHDYSRYLDGLSVSDSAVRSAFQVGHPVQEVVPGRLSGHIVKFFCQCFLSSLRLEAKVGKQPETGQNSIYEVSPLSIRRYRIFQPDDIFACGKSRTGAGKGLGIVWYSVPDPGTRQMTLLKLLMNADHFFIDFSRVIVVPSKPVQAPDYGFPSLQSVSSAA